MQQWNLSQAMKVRSYDHSKMSRMSSSFTYKCLSGASNMTYNELGIFGYLRKVLRCGPVQTFLKLVDFWKPISPLLIAAKVLSNNINRIRTIIRIGFEHLGQAILLSIRHVQKEIHSADTKLSPGELFPGLFCLSYTFIRPCFCYLIFPGLF